MYIYIYMYNKHSDHSVGPLGQTPSSGELLQAERSEPALLQADGMVLEMNFLGIILAD